MEAKTKKDGSELVERLTQEDKLHLIAVVADQVARKYRIKDACDLWGVGWEACQVAEATWKGGGTLAGRTKWAIQLAMNREAAYPMGRRRKELTGTLEN